MSVRPHAVGLDGPEIRAFLLLRDSGTMITPWRIEFFGGLRAISDGREIVRFQTRKTGLLLAYLAYNLREDHSRDELMELFWPDSEWDRGSQSLSQALTSLRKQLEPPGVPLSTFLIAPRRFARLNPSSITTDVAEFLSLIESAKSTDDPDEKLQLHLRAVEMYHGGFLPGCYDDWVLVSRERLLVMHLQALRQIVLHLEERGSYQDALDFGLRAISAAHDSEEAHYDLMRLYLKLGRPHDAQEQYRRLSRILRRDLGLRPSPEIVELTKLIRLQTGILVRRDPAYRATRPPGSVVASTPAEDLPKPEQASKSPEPVRLPLVLTRFFGREVELQRLLEALQQGAERLVTLAGPGGAGKTRLALELSHRISADYAQRVYFVPLADLHDARSLPDALANALGVPRSPVGDLELMTVNALAGAPALVVFDNFEHLEPEAAEWVWGLLQKAPTLTCLITSRQPLDLQGEVVIPLRPLPIPSRPGTPDRLMEFACVQMFVDRAQAVSPDFQITSRNAPVVAAICEKLEGVPLAIELAAARAQSISPTQMLSQLGRRLSFLVSRKKNVEPRHQSIRSAIAWSYDLLPADMARFYSQLSVFRGTWTLEQAQQVCGIPDAFELVDALVQRSLIVTELLAEDDMRFRILETLREYTDEMLDEADRRSLYRLHAEHFLQIAESAESSFRSADSTSAYTRIEMEHDNFRAALSRFTNDEIGLRLAAALWRFWFVRGYVGEGRQWLEVALAGSQEPTITRARALNGLGVLAYHLGDQKCAESALTSSLNLAKRFRDASAKAEAYNNLGVLAGDRGDSRTARENYELCLDLRKKMGDRWGEAACLNNLGRISQDQDDHLTAIDYYRRSRQLFEQLGDRSQAAIVLNNEGSAAFEQLKFRPAYVCYQHSLDLFRELGNRWGEALLHHNIGEVRLRQGDLRRAREHFEQSLHMNRDLGDKAGMAETIASLGNVARCESQPYTAAKLMAAAESAQAKLGIPLGERARSLRELDIRAMKAELREEDFAAAWAAGAALSLDRAVALALHCDDTEPLEQLVA